MHNSKTAFPFLHKYKNGQKRSAMYFSINTKRLRAISGITIIGAACLAMPSCKQQEIRVPLENDKNAPAQVTNVKVESLHGGARINYSIPHDEDLLYVQADYKIRDEIKQEVTASYYANSLEIHGFADTSSHEVILYAVDRSGNKSEPVTVKVNPLKSPVQLAYDSLTYDADFGGIHVNIKNEAQGNLVTTVMIKDSTGDWEEYDKNYSGLPDIDFSVRGLPSVTTTFGVFIRDRWDNHSDTLVKVLKPYFEEELDKNKFNELFLDNDTKSTWALSGLWNISTTQFSGWHSANNAGVPVWFTFDLGVKAKLSRFRTWQVHDGREYSSGNIKQFQVWGSNDPNPDGTFDSWTKLMDCEVKKPSGLPMGQLTNEDKETAAAGDEFVLPLSAPPVRYIRFKIISTFANPAGSVTGSSWLLELSFWGQEVD